MKTVKYVVENTTVTILAIADSPRKYKNAVGIFESQKTCRACGKAFQVNEDIFTAETNKGKGYICEACKVSVTGMDQKEVAEVKNIEEAKRKNGLLIDELKKKDKGIKTLNEKLSEKEKQFEAFDKEIASLKKEIKKLKKEG